jgi:hypothetical protein
VRVDPIRMCPMAISQLNTLSRPNARVGSSALGKCSRREKGRSVEVCRKAWAVCDKLIGLFGFIPMVRLP